MCTKTERRENPRKSKNDYIYTLFASECQFMFVVFWVFGDGKNNEMLFRELKSIINEEIENGLLAKNLNGVTWRSRSMLKYIKGVIGPFPDNICNTTESLHEYLW